MLKLNNKYSLSILRSVEKEDFSSELSGKGIYICELPTNDWHKNFKIEKKNNFSINKKLNFLNKFGVDSICLSPSGISYNKKTSKFFEKNIIHLSNIKGHFRIRQLYLMLKITKFLVKKRKSYGFVMYYNFDFYTFFSSIFLKILGVKIIVDFEDDYSTLTKNYFFKLFLTKILYRIPDTVVCINENMKKYFPTKKTYVFNGFIDLSYMKPKKYKFKKFVSLFFGGTIDLIRGADLITEICNALVNLGIKFEINITGICNNQEIIKSFLDWKQIKYHGYVNEKKYNDLIFKSDYCLVLQKPDLLFNQGSFPSKIEYYSGCKKPILKLVLN